MRTDFLRVLMRPTGDGKPRAILTEDGAWVDGQTMTLADYRRRYGGKARHEARVSRLTLADLVEAGSDA